MRTTTDTPTSNASAWLSVTSAATYLDTTPAALRKRIERGQVPAFRFGSSIRVRRADLDKLMVAIGPLDAAQDVTARS